MPAQSPGSEPERARRKVRPLVVRRDDGPIIEFVKVRAREQVDRVEAAFAAQWNFVYHRGPAADVEALAGITIDGYVAESDPDAIRRMALAGEFDVGERYREVFG